MYAIKVIALSYFFLLLMSCEKKEESYKEPQVEFLSPYNNQLFSVYDTVEIVANIFHERVIQQIELSIVDKDLKPVVSGNIIYATKDTVSLNSFLVINNRYIEESTHYLKLQISDGQNNYNIWQEISISPLARQLESILAVTGVGNQNNLSKYSIDGTAKSLFNWESDNLGGYADSQYLRFYTSGSRVDGLRAWSLLNNQQLWNIPVIPNDPLPTYTYFYAKQGLVFVGKRDGHIYGYDADGGGVYKTDPFTNGTYTGIHSLKKFIVAIFKPYSGNLNSFILFNYPAGNVFRQTQFAGNVIKMIDMEGNKLLMIIEENGVNKAIVYDAEANNFIPSLTITSEDISAVASSQNHVFISTPNSILWYRPKLGSVVTYLTTEHVTSIAFDENTMQLFVAANSYIKVYNPPWSAEVRTMEANETIKQLHLLYNK